MVTYSAGAPDGSGSFEDASAAISRIIAGAGSGCVLGDMIQSVGVNFEHFWHSRGARVMALPGSRWSVGLPRRDMVLSAIRLRVDSRAMIGLTSAEITRKVLLSALSLSLMVM